MDGGGGRPSAVAATPKNNKQNKNGDVAPAVPIEQVRGGISDALRGHLASLGATAPACVAWKTLQMSDVHKNQARLLFSCKGEGEPPRCPLAACLTDREARFVAGDGLLVAALDRGGRRHDLLCKYLVSNHGYRFITGWKRLVEDNGLRQGMRVDLWAFRSRLLPNRYEGGGKVAVRTEDIGHPDGSLGMVVLHYDDERNLEHGEAAALPAVRETVTTAGQVKSEPEEKVAAAGGAAARAELAMTFEEMIATSGLRTFLAALGLIRLKEALWPGGGE